MRWLDIDEIEIIPGADELKMLSAGNYPKLNCSAVIPVHKRIFYKHLTIAELQSLRCLIYQNQSNELVDIEPWFEATLRFCEVNMWCLEKRMSELWGRDKAPAVTVLTTALMLETYLMNKDLRFLNAVLKMQRSPFFPSQQVLKNTKGAIIDLSIVIYDVVDSERKERLI